MLHDCRQSHKVTYFVRIWKPSSSGPKTPKCRLIKKNIESGRFSLSPTLSYQKNVIVLEIIVPEEREDRRSCTLIVTFSTLHGRSSSKSIGVCLHSQFMTRVYKFIEIVVTFFVDVGLSSDAILSSIIVYKGCYKHEDDHKTTYI